MAKSVPPDADGHFWVLSRQLRRDLDTDGGAMLRKDYSQRALLTSRLLKTQQDANMDPEMASAQSLAQTQLQGSSLYCRYEYL